MSVVCTRNAKHIRNSNCDDVAPIVGIYVSLIQEKSPDPSKTIFAAKFNIDQIQHNISFEALDDLRHRLDVVLLQPGAVGVARGLVVSPEALRRKE